MNRATINRATAVVTAVSALVLAVSELASNVKKSLHLDALPWYVGPSAILVCVVAFVWVSRDRIRAHPFVRLAWSALTASSSVLTLFIVVILATHDVILNRELTTITSTTSQLIRALDSAGATSTRYVGTFPANMDPIIQLIQGVDQKLDIMADYPAYGKFSRPEQSAAYQAAIVKKLDDKNVSIVAYTDTRGRTQTKDQFKKYTSRQLENVLNDPQDQAFASRFRHYFEVHNQNARTWDEFFELLAREDIAIKQTIRGRRRGSIVEVDDVLPVFVWIRDDREAIFSFYTLGDDAREVSFYTSDPLLVDVLKTIYAKYSLGQVLK